MHINFMLLAMAFSGTVEAGADEPGDEAAAIAKVELLGGKVEVLTAFGEGMHVHIGHKSKMNEKHFHLLKRVGKLRHLVVENEVTDLCLKGLAELECLESLILDDCAQISDAGVARLALVDTLRQLHLHDCPQITDRGVKELCKLKNLEDLQLGGTQITDFGLLELSVLTKLRQIELGSRVPLVINGRRIDGDWECIERESAVTNEGIAQFWKRRFHVMIWRRGAKNRS